MAEINKISVVTGLYPTTAEPYRGAPIWRTLQALQRLAEIEVFCTLPRYFWGMRPKSFRYNPQPAETAQYGIHAVTVKYPAVPVLSRMVNASMIYRALRHTPASRPDLILAYYIYPEAYAAVRLGEHFGVPVVVSARGSDLKRIDPHPVVRTLTLETLHRSAAVLCVSDDLSRIACGLGASTQNVHTVANGVDTEVFRFRSQMECRDQIGIPADERLILFVGWLSALKGVPQLIDAVALFRQRRPERWRLVLIGEGEMEADLRRRAIDRGLGDNVSFVGPQDAPMIANWINACDCLCLPSETEGCPNVVLEALACGSPVVATSVGGIPELVTSQSGVLIPANTAEAIAAGLERAAGTPWDREKIARANRRSWEQVARETYDVCVEATRRSRTTGPKAVAYDAR